jgi:hypothetical protein
VIPKREPSAQVDAPAAAAPMRARVEMIVVRMMAGSVMMMNTWTHNWQTFYIS